MPDYAHADWDDGSSKPVFEVYDPQADYHGDMNGPVVISRTELAKLKGQLVDTTEVTDGDFKAMLGKCRTPEEVMNLAAKIGLPTTMNRPFD